MGKEWAVILVALAGVVSRPASAQEQFICISDKATGFRWEQSRKSWEIARFNVRDEKFLVQEIEPTDFLGKTYSFEVKKFGSDEVRHRCERFKYEAYVHPTITCGGIGFGMWINTKTLRFQEVYALGYIDGEDDLKNTPSLTLGTCTRVK